MIDGQLQHLRGSPNASATVPILNGCRELHRPHRWTSNAVGNALRDYLFYNDGFRCLRENNVELDPAYYLVKERITHHNRRDHFGKPRPTWKVPTSMHSPLEPFPDDKRPKTDLFDLPGENIVSYLSFISKKKSFQIYLLFSQ